MERLRVFVAVELSAEIKALVEQLQEQIKELVPDSSVRWADPAGTHITLKYLGETDQIATIKAELDRITVPPFTLETAPTGVFPNARQPRILWLGVGGDLAALGQLQQKVEQAIAPLGFPTEPRPFSPHITLGRTKEQARIERTRLEPVSLGRLVVPEIRWQVDHVVLMHSQTTPNGARYTPIHAVQFDGR